jgi:hypothetical protein
MTGAEVARFKPDVLVVNDTVRNRFAGLEHASRFYDPSQFVAAYNFYRALEDGRLGFTVVRVDGPVHVYTRTQPVATLRDTRRQ